MSSCCQLVFCIMVGTKVEASAKSPRKAGYFLIFSFICECVLGKIQTFTLPMMAEILKFNVCGDDKYWVSLFGNFTDSSLAAH